MADIRHVLSLDAKALISAAVEAAEEMEGVAEAIGTAEGSSKKLRLTTVALGAALAATAAAFAKGITSAIAYGDALGKMSERTGVSVEKLSLFRLAAENSDTSLESLARGLKSLSKGMFDASIRGTGPVADGLNALGLSATDANGKLRSSEAVVNDVSAAFSRMENGTEKAALAAKLFGGAGEELIPLLNMGASGLDLMAEKSRALGVAWDDDASQAAEDFGDSLNVLRTAALGVFSQAAQFWIPTLSDVASAFENATLKAAGFSGSAGLDDAALFAKQGAEAREKLAKNTTLLRIAEEDLNFAQSEGSGVTRHALKVARERVEALKASVAANQLAITASEKAAANASAEADAIDKINERTRERIRLAEGVASEADAVEDAEARKRAARQETATEWDGLAALMRAKRQRDDALQIEDEQARNAELERLSEEYYAERERMAEESARERENIEKAITVSLLNIAGQLAGGIISSLRDLNRERTKDVKQRREREIGLAILMGELQAGIAFATTLAQIGGTPAGYAAAAAAAAAVGVATKISAGVAASKTSDAFHDGGLVGDEVNIRARLGEYVVPPQDVRAAGGPQGVQQALSGGGSGDVTVIQKLDHRVLDVQTHRAVKRTGSPLDSALRATNPRGTGRRNPYSPRV